MSDSIDSNAERERPVSDRESVTLLWWGAVYGASFAAAITDGPVGMLLVLSGGVALWLVARAVLSLCRP